MTVNFAADQSLKSYNTLAINVSARYFYNLTEADQLPEVLTFAEEKNLPVLILGGGSNVVLTKDFPGVVIKIAVRGITHHDDKTLLTIAAGENWHGLVIYCLQNNCYGLENLSLIPGTVGAAPIQNIGAYGVEFEQFFVSLTGWDRETKQWRTLKKTDCQFDYRDSIFKNQLKDKFIITEVTLKLSDQPKAVCDYPALKDYLLTSGISEPLPMDVSEAVIAIRQSKLPDPNQLPNVGSFFKNPVIDAEQAELLAEKYRNLVQFPIPNGQVKLAAGWLLEQAGWKGKEYKNEGLFMHDRQSLVMVNKGVAEGMAVIDFATTIQQDIQDRFGVSLEIEPVIY